MSLEDAYTDDGSGLSGSDWIRLWVMTTLTEMESLDSIGADLQALPRGTFPSAGLSRPWEANILGLNTITLLVYIPG